MTVRSRSSLRFSVRREDQSRAPPARTNRRRPHLESDEGRTTISHSKSAPNFIHNPIENTSKSHLGSLRPTKPPLQSHTSRSRRRSPLSSQRPADNVDDHHERPYKKPKLDGRYHEAAAALAKQPLRNHDPYDRAESPDPLIAVSSPVDTPPARPRVRPPQQPQTSAFVTVSPPSPGLTRSTRRSLQHLPVAVDDDAEKHHPVGLTDSNGRGAGRDGASQDTNQAQIASDGYAAITERRSLRSHAGGSRSKSELAMYFQNYEQMLSLDPPKPEFLTGDITVVLVDDLTEPPLSPQPPPSSPSRSRKHRGSDATESPFGNPLLHLHNCETVTLPEPDSHPDADPLGDATYFKAHRRIERQEKQLRNIEKERAQHEKVQLDRLLDELQGHDWLRVMGISGITDTEKKLYEPRRALFIKEVSALIDKFRVWKEEEKRRKLEKEQLLRERDTPAAETDHEAFDEEEEEEDEVEDAEEAEEEKEALPNGTASSDVVSYGEPPDINDVDAWAARQLLQEARSAGGKRAKASAERPQSHTPEPPPPPEPEKPFTSFYAKRYLRDAALGHHRRGRTRSAFGHPIPEMEEREFQLPPDILTEEAIHACHRKRRRLKRESKD